MNQVPDRLPDETSKRLLAELHPDWKLDLNRIRRRFVFPDFRSAMDFANHVTEISETAHHHPDLSVSYGALEVFLSTHSVGGITEKDFALAKQIDEIPCK